MSVSGKRYETVTVAEYIWTDVQGIPRSKSRVLPAGDDDKVSLSSFPIWNYDGSSTGQAETLDSEVWLMPRSIYRDPFIGHPNAYLVLCETYEPSNEPHATNTRAAARQVHEAVKAEHDPWFGIEQEFFLLDTTSGRPLGFPSHHLQQPRAQGPFYCGVGDANALGRKFVTAAYLTCLDAGVKVCGMNGEVAPGQWEIQVGPLPGVEAADDIIMLRYILHRVSECTGVSVEFGAKPIADYNGSGAHTNFSTTSIRDEDKGREAIDNAIKALERRHKHHLKLYAGRHNDNALRLTGTHETSDPNVFSSGIGARDASIRIPTQVNEKGYGYLEDRRPSSSCDPYLVVHALMETVCGEI
jgi:glutamine synthetase